MDQSVDHREPGTVAQPAGLSGVRTARVVAFLIDYAIVFLISIPLLVIVGIPAFLLGVGIPILGIVAVAYVAFTMGGQKQATLGMRLMGVRVFRDDGATVGPALAALHAVLFWFIHIVGIMLALLVTFFSSKKRLLHDILLGTYVARG